MISIGNDIVDLHFIDKVRTQSKPFYSKILSEPEQHLYPTHFNSIPFWQYVWLLWSCKEAVYKYAKRLQPDLVFSPVKICLQPRSLSEPEFSGFKDGQDLKANKKFYHFFHFTNSGLEILCNSAITKDYIHTIAYAETYLNNITNDVKRINDTGYNSQSAGVRKLVSDKLTDLLPGADISFGRSDAGYPIIIDHGVDTGIVASFAHHGNYIAYSFLKD